jgi:prolyl oligopeptidase
MLACFFFPPTLPHQPQVRRDDAVVDTLHGTPVADPYRWLEDPDSDETKAFVDAQNVVTNAVLAQCDTRDAFKSLMTRLYDYPRYSCPSKQGER